MLNKKKHTIKKSHHFPQANAKSRLRNAAIVTRKSWMDATCNSEKNQGDPIWPDPKFVYPLAQRSNSLLKVELVVVVHGIFFCDNEFAVELREIGWFGGGGNDSFGMLLRMWMDVFDLG